MPSIKDTATEKNLLTAFAAESQDRNRFTYYASVAKLEGYELVAALLNEAANHEKEYAKRLFKFFEGGVVEITASYPTSGVGGTAANLAAAAQREGEKSELIYPEYAKKAVEEGFSLIAEVFLSIAKAQAQHAADFQRLNKLLTDGEMFKREESVRWRCRNCGYLTESEQAPEVCPCCGHAQGYFEVVRDQY
ncbi:MAG: rubrerythrin family protein [Succinivibrio sp.]|nr:rubrerythrin family protein [Succinivibrio sp.]